MCNSQRTSTRNQIGTAEQGQLGGDCSLLAQDLRLPCHLLAHVSLIGQEWNLKNFEFSDWVPGNPKRPYPTDVDMRAGILSQFTATGFIQPNAGVGGPGGGAGGDKGDNKQVPPAQLGTDGLAAVMTASGDGNPVNSIGNTWRNRGSVTEMPEEANMTINFGSPGGVISSSDSSDSSIGD